MSSVWFTPLIDAAFIKLMVVNNACLLTYGNTIRSMRCLNSIGLPLFRFAFTYI